LIKENASITELKKELFLMLQKRGGGVRHYKGLEGGEGKGKAKEQRGNAGDIY